MGHGPRIRWRFQSAGLHDARQLNGKAAFTRMKDELSNAADSR
jgi:hypothetical protein